MPTGEPTTPATDAGPAVERAWREERAAVLAVVARRLGDLQLAEDAVQEAFAAAAAHWPREGVPARPGAWLTTTAWRKAVDGLRRDHFPVTHREPIGTVDGPDSDLADPRVREDDVLSLVLTCCHPALAADVQVALTLRHVVGLSDRQIAARFLVPESTMTKRLVRGRAKIRDARISFELPGRDQLAARLDQVHTVVYLVFTEGYLSTGDGPAVRAELCTEALWLARQLNRLVPDDLETTGLLALLLLQHARAEARQDGSGRLVPYAAQDRSRWDQRAVEEAKVLLAKTTAQPPGPYQLQAAIALLHATAAPGDEPHWSLIADLYTALLRQGPSPVVETNRAVAVGRAHGSDAGLRSLRSVLADPRLQRYLPLRAAYADLLEQARDPTAAEVWRSAAALADNAAQRDELLRRARLAESSG